MNNIDDYLSRVVREEDYLSKQDSEYINIINELTDILIMHGSEEKVKGIIQDFIHYVDKYAYPAGLAQRVWAYDDAIDEAVRNYEQNFSTGSK